MMNRLLASTCSLALIGASALVVVPQATAKDNARYQTQTRTERAMDAHPWTQSSTVTVVSAEALEGEDVHDRNGNRLGHVQALVLDQTANQVRYVIVDPDAMDGFDDQFVPIPWQSIDMAFRDGDADLMVDRAQLSKARAFDEDKLEQALSPKIQTIVYDYWKPVGGVGVTDSDNPDRQTSYLLLDSGVVSVLTPKLGEFSELEGSDVIASDNAELGEIDSIMIDRKSGAIAFSTVAHGGFLGFGETYAPVPLKALSYDMDENAYRLDMSEQAFEKLPQFDVANTPQKVRVDHIEQLYKNYDVPAGWSDS